MKEHIARNEKQLGAILRRLRRQAGLSQLALGAHVHLRQATVSRLEAGAPAAQLNTLMAALAALDLELVVRRRSKGSASDIEGML
jgi:HTH-type transcriptional regulator / antitoxin HipB